MLLISDLAPWSLEYAVDDPVVLCRVARPMHVDAVRPRVGLEPFEIFVEMAERVFLYRRGKRPKFLPFGNATHFAVALLPQIPEPLVVHLLVLGRGDEARGGFCLVDRPAAVDLCAARLRLGPATSEALDAPSA